MSLLILASGSAYAALEGGVSNSYSPGGSLSTGDTTSAEFLRQQGYSDEMRRLHEVRLKDPTEPRDYEQKTNGQKVGIKVLETIDPTLDTKHFGERNINFNGVTVEDL